MKVRKFYPRQVLRRLQGEHEELTLGQFAALRYLMLRSRKLGYSISAGPAASREDVLAAASAKAAQAVFANSLYRIMLRPAV
jgi:hypothetical protein